MAARKHSKLISYLESNYSEFEPERKERLKALYSDFSKLWILNKYGYDTNIEFWKRVILDCNQQGYLCSLDYSLGIDKNTISEKFLKPVIGKPISLDTVIDSMKEELISVHEFEKRYKDNSSWYSWIMNSFTRDTTITTEELIVLPTLRSIVKAILNHHNQQERINDIMTLSEFKKKYAYKFFNQVELTDQDVDLILKYLHSQHGVAIANHSCYIIIKFPSKENEIAAITEQDKAVISIRTTCHALSIQVNQLEQKSQELSQEAIQEKKKGHIPKAMYCIKRKKSLQEVLEKRLRSMETMDTILMKIESSQDDIQVIQAFNLGADTLRNIIQYDGLDVDAVDDVMHKVQLALQDQQDIQDAIQMTSEDLSNTSDKELENELSQLLYQEHLEDKPPQENIPDNASELARLNRLISPPTTTVQKKKELAS